MGLFIVASGCGAKSRQEHPPAVAPLAVVAAPTPHFRVPRYDTSGTYPQVRGDLELRAVNAALRETVLADQSEYTPSDCRQPCRTRFFGHI
jgi:hypothetical protein